MLLPRSAMLSKVECARWRFSREAPFSRGEAPRAGASPKKGKGDEPPPFCTRIPSILASFN